MTGQHLRDLPVFLRAPRAAGLWPDERWLPVVGYEGRYEVSDRGHIFSTGGQRQKPRILKPVPDRYGYLYVCLWNGTRKNRKIHELVLTAFAGPRPDGMEGCHNNGVKTDNCWPENLRWDTSSANRMDAVRHGTAHFWSYDRKGERSHSAKLTEADVREIRRRAGLGVSQRQLAHEFRVCKANIYMITSGKTWEGVQ
jgi:hypothetical protein